ncbi:hypothetical protein FN976_26200 [Caenimonas sedimenti]|uniref:HNH endonuclease n=1 Tax=Caenimonas sedimenti TaxID=2596921 RepID=A0A562ZGV0_9BURK|nr:hypothetical protein [Caenimonas sedimenti]TWO67027.1 hypothetical protein FN976_26200 [Caenimonas sedimenti]
MTSSKTIARERDHACKNQGGYCCYCTLPMLPVGDASPLECTAEHLQALCDGGTHRGNIAAAHRWCNQRRHDLFQPAPPPEKYRQIVEKQVANNTWFSTPLLKQLEEYA